MTIEALVPYVKLQDDGGAVSLNSYMQLPVSQYYELDPQMIRPLGGNRFALTVPRVEVGPLSLHTCYAHGQTDFLS